jgi:hypothetical protein
MHDVNQNKFVSTSPFWEISERVIDINDRFISVMNDKEGEIFCVFTRALPPISAVTAPDSPAVLNSTGAALSTAQSCYNMKC